MAVMMRRYIGIDVSQSKARDLCAFEEATMHLARDGQLSHGL